ncbi:MAG: hypothetical protein Q9162_004231 [Coniocarpon cinnabarinum]
MAQGGSGSLARELFQDTAFGFFVRLLSGGKYLAWEDTYDQNALSKYLSTAETPLERAQTRESQRQVTQQASRKAQDAEANSSDDAASIGSPDDDPKDQATDFEVIDWVKPYDPKNPRQWPSWKKFFATGQICLLTTSVYIGSAIYTAGLQDVVHTFHVSETAALLGLTLFVCGYGLGPMVWAPMSEVPFFGRNPIYIGTLFVFVGLQPAVIYAPNFGALLAFRFLTGLFGSPALATGGASIADMYAPNKQAYGIAFWGVSAVFGPVLGPLVGGFAAQANGWRWTIWELMWLSAFCLIFLFFFFPETSASNILFRRANRLRAERAKLESNEKQLPLKTEAEIEAEGMSGKEIALMVFVRPFTLSFFEPVVLALNLYIALLYALLYLWFESFPIVFVGMYHFNSGTLGLAFVGILIGAFIAIGPFFWYLYKFQEPQFRADGNIKPEYRLPPAFVGGFCIPICLFWFGWSAGNTHWIMPIIGTVWFTIGAFCLFMSVLAYLGDAYPRYVASVYAGNDLMRSSFGAGFPLFANAMFHRLGIDWGCSLLAFLSMLFIPIPFILYRYGERIRGVSKMARHDI